MDSDLKLVSVIGISYKHVSFLERSILSVLQQDYSHIELIWIDDASNDGSVEIIKKLHEAYSFQWIQNTENLGICKSFNLGFQIAKGRYIIDFSGDDIMFHNRISKQIAFFQDQKTSVGLITCNHLSIDKDNNPLIKLFHASKYRNGPIFLDNIQRQVYYSGCLMIKREVLEQTQGYNESLSYEDFYFSLAASYYWDFAHLDKFLHMRRFHKNSFSQEFNIKNKPLHLSTIEVIQIVDTWQISSNERIALFIRLLREGKRALSAGMYNLVPKYIHVGTNIILKYIMK